MPNYCTRANLEIIYGEVNIRTWADLDNNRDHDKIEERIEYACETATEELNSALAEGKYEVPFTTPPKLVVFLAALEAGVILFEARLVTDSSPPRDQVARQKKKYRKMLQKIKAGQIRLLDSLSGEPLEVTCPTYPTVLSAEDNLYDDLDCNSVCDPCNTAHLPPDWT